MKLREVGVEEAGINAFGIGEEWMLVTAGGREGHNSMTVGWGSYGNLWNRKTITVYISSERHTYEYMERSEYYSVSYFDEGYREALYKMGNASGREYDKDAESGLTVAYSEEGVAYYEESRLVLICKKLYGGAAMEKGKMGEEGRTVYKDGRAVHEIYIGEIKKVLKRG